MTTSGDDGACGRAFMAQTGRFGFRFHVITSCWCVLPRAPPVVGRAQRNHASAGAEGGASLNTLVSAQPRQLCFIVMMVGKMPASRHVRRYFGNVQVTILTWKNNDPDSFSVVFRRFAEDVIDEPYDEYDLVQLAIDLFSRKYAKLESEILNLKFVRLLLPE